MDKIKLLGSALNLCLCLQVPSNQYTCLKGSSGWTCLRTLICILILFSGLIDDCDECTVDSNGVANHEILTAKHHHSYSLQHQEISSNIDQEIEQ